MLTIKHIHGRVCPVILCDWCGEEINKAKEGNYEWVFESIADGGYVRCAEVINQKRIRICSEVFFTHKKCCRAFEQANNQWQFGADELALLPMYLMTNLQMTYKEGIEAERVKNFM